MKALAMTDGFRDTSYFDIINELVPELKSCARGHLVAEKFPRLKFIFHVGQEKHRGMYNTNELILLGMNFTIFGLGQDQLSRVDGAILLGIFVWYLWSSFKSDKGNASESTEDGEGIKEYSILKSIIFVIIGLAGLVVGGRLFVNSATELAKLFGVSDKFIAITVMAAGTCMPELATCVVAALKGKGQLALGNVLGSNISNILLILGGAALINRLSFSGMTYIDLTAVMISAIFIFLTVRVYEKRRWS
jgi:cation:H+ antiporter